MRYGQLVLGPAGSGKSTYCHTVPFPPYIPKLGQVEMAEVALEMAEAAAAGGRRAHVVNLDPAAESLAYQPLADIRELVSLPSTVVASVVVMRERMQVSVEDVMEDEELGLGPNGALVKALEFLVEEELGWLQDVFAEEDDLYVLFDCPGQVAPLLLPLSFPPTAIPFLRSSSTPTTT